MLDCCSDIDDVLVILVLVVMVKVLLEGSEELTDKACMLVAEDWWLSDISEFGFDIGAVLVTPVAWTYVICMGKIFMRPLRFCPEWLVCRAT